MKEHDHATIHKPGTKPAHDEGGRRTRGAEFAEGRFQNAAYRTRMLAAFRKRFWISLVLTLPILALSPMLQTLVGLREAIRFPGDVYVLFGLSSAVFWYGSWLFLKGFLEELKSQGPG